MNYPWKKRKEIIFEIINSSKHIKNIIIIIINFIRSGKIKALNY